MAGLTHSYVFVRLTSAVYLEVVWGVMKVMHRKPPCIRGRGVTHSPGWDP